MTTKQKITQWLVILLILFWGLVLMLCSCRSSKVNKTKTETKTDSVAVVKKDSVSVKKETATETNLQITNGEVEIEFSNDTLKQVEGLKPFIDLIPYKPKKITLKFGQLNANKSTSNKTDSVVLIKSDSTKLVKSEKTFTKQKETKRVSMWWLWLLLLPVAYYLNKRFKIFSIS